ncbi:hypothetical protein QFC22_005708 [Naganishia vaughanmartiniae]|uniref:Uncharacterized protein n=1 Tax=Naganishia vaughanmartiniae TaxID=1424756 RepID=A0ACC2WT24_9TREE|nr:hypothetical protein QFC22_005708 [Naganishia vaughanmartiniae]
MNIPPLTEEVVAQQVAKIRAADKLRVAVHQIMPPLLEKLNDAKERVHKPAESCLIDLGNVVFRKPSSSSTSSSNLSSSTGSVATGKGKEKETSAQMYERILVSAFEAKGSRSKVGGMRVLCGVRQQTRTLGLKIFLPLLVGMLEDGDGSVREEAKSTLVDLLSPSDIPASARSELQKLMQSRSLKSSLVDGIMSGILAGPQTRQEGESGHGAAGKAVSGAGESDVPPVLIVTERDLEKEFMAILPPFEGKETEHNWQAREAGIMRVRGMLQSGVHKQFPGTFMSCLRQDFWQESVKAASSPECLFLPDVMTLRTTLSMSTSALYAETAQAFGESFDPLMDTLLPHLTKLSGSTKKMVAEASQRTVTMFINNAACHPRTFLPFLAAGLNERTVQSRQYFMEHTRHYLAVHTTRSSSTKTAIEHATTTIGPGLQVVADMLKRGLQDANPIVKETARATFVIFHNEWPKHALALMSGLDDSATKQLEKAIQAAATATGADVGASHPGTGNEMAAPPAPTSSGARRPGAGTARKPSSAIAAAIRKAKEEAKARQLAEAEANAAAQSSDPTDDEEQVGGKEAAEEVSQPCQPMGAPSVETVDQALSTASNERTSPLPAAHPAIPPHDTSILHSAEPVSTRQNIHAPLSPTTPVKPISLLDFDTPNGAAPPFKVMTPLKPVLLESTGINLLDPTHFPSSEPGPTSDSSKPTPPARQENIRPPVVVDSATPSNSTAVEHAVDAGRSRKPRVSVNPVKEMVEPAPLFRQLSHLVDYSFWLERRQEYEQTEDVSAVPARLTELNARPSDLTQDDLCAMIAWSTAHSHCETDANVSETYSTDEEIRRHVHRGFRQDRALADEESRLGAQVKSMLKIVEDTLVNQTEDRLLKDVLFLLWNLVIHQPQYVKEEETHQIIRACFALRGRSESLSVQRGTAGMLAFVAEASQEPVRIIDAILVSATVGGANDRSQGQSSDQRTNMVVFALIHIADIVLGLSSETVVEDVVPRVKPLILTAINNSKSIAFREAAYTTITAIYSVVQDESVLFGDLFPELGAAQRKLTMIMIRRDLPGAGEKTVATE